MSIYAATACEDYSELLSHLTEQFPTRTRHDHAALAFAIRVVDSYNPTVHDTYLDDGDPTETERAKRLCEFVAPGDFSAIHMRSLALKTVTYLMSRRAEVG
jgi:hypothetical protein